MSEVDHYEELLRQLKELQDGKCAMCSFGKELLVDHDHDNGFIRGLLCHSCNIEEPRHICNRHDCAWCLYRKTPPVSYLGWTVKYWSSWGDGLMLPQFETYKSQIARKLTRRQELRSNMDALI